MKYEFNRDLEITYSYVDNTGRLGLVNTFLILQDMCTDYFESFGSDNFTLKTNDNAVWALTKTKVKLNKTPTWGSIIHGKSYCIKDSAIRFESETEFKDENDEVVFVAKQEFCAIDVNERKARKISTITYPNDMEYQESKYLDEYKRMKLEFGKEDFCFDYKVMLSDIDYSSHVNNVVYTRLFMNTFSSDFLKNKKIQSFEIAYIAETKEADILEIYKKQTDYNKYEFLIKKDDKDCTRAIMEIKE